MSRYAALLLLVLLLVLGSCAAAETITGPEHVVTDHVYLGELHVVLTGGAGSGRVHFTRVTFTGKFSMAHADAAAADVATPRISFENCTFVTNELLFSGLGPLLSGANVTFVDTVFDKFTVVRSLVVRSGAVFALRRCRSLNNFFLEFDDARDAFVSVADHVASTRLSLNFDHASNTRIDVHRGNFNDSTYAFAEVRGQDFSNGSVIDIAGCVGFRSVVQLTDIGLRTGAAVIVRGNHFDAGEDRNDVVGAAVKLKSIDNTSRLVFIDNNMDARRNSLGYATLVSVALATGAVATDVDPNATVEFRNNSAVGESARPYGNFHSLLICDVFFSAATWTRGLHARDPTKTVAVSINVAAAEGALQLGASTMLGALTVYGDEGSASRPTGCVSAALDIRGVTVDRLVFSGHPCVRQMSVADSSIEYLQLRSVFVVDGCLAIVDNNITTQHAPEHNLRSVFFYDSGATRANIDIRGNRFVRWHRNAAGRHVVAVFQGMPLNAATVAITHNDITAVNPVYGNNAGITVFSIEGYLGTNASGFVVTDNVMRIDEYKQGGVVVDLPGNRATDFGDDRGFFVWRQNTVPSNFKHNASAVVPSDEGGFSEGTLLQTGVSLPAAVAASFLNGLETPYRVDVWIALRPGGATTTTLRNMRLGGATSAIRDRNRDTSATACTDRAMMASSLLLENVSATGYLLVDVGTCNRRVELRNVSAGVGVRVDHVTATRGICAALVFADIAAPGFELKLGTFHDPRAISFDRVECRNPDGLTCIAIQGTVANATTASVALRLTDLVTNNTAATNKLMHGLRVTVAGDLSSAEIDVRQIHTIGHVLPVDLSACTGSPGPASVTVHDVRFSAKAGHDAPRAVVAYGCELRGLLELSSAVLPATMARALTAYDLADGAVVVLRDVSIPGGDAAAAPATAVPTAGPLQLVNAGGGGAAAALFARCVGLGDPLDRSSFNWAEHYGAFFTSSSSGITVVSDAGSCDQRSSGGGSCVAVSDCAWVRGGRCPQHTLITAQWNSTTSRCDCLCAGVWLSRFGELPCPLAASSIDEAATMMGVPVGPRYSGGTGLPSSSCVGFVGSPDAAPADLESTATRTALSSSPSSSRLTMTSTVTVTSLPAVPPETVTSASHSAPHPPPTPPMVATATTLPGGLPPPQPSATRGASTPPGGDGIHDDGATSSLTVSVLPAAALGLGGRTPSEAGAAADVISIGAGFGDGPATAVVAGATGSAVLTSMSSPLAASRASRVGAAARLSMCAAGFEDDVDANSEPKPPLLEAPFRLPIGESRLRWVTGAQLVASGVQAVLVSAYALPVLAPTVTTGRVVVEVLRVAAPAWVGYFGPTATGYAVLVLVAQRERAAGLDTVVALAGLLVQLASVGFVAHVLFNVAPRTLSQSDSAAASKGHEATAAGNTAVLIVSTDAAQTSSSTSTACAPTPAVVRSFAPLYDGARDVAAAAPRCYMLVELGAAVATAALTAVVEGSAAGELRCLGAGVGVVVVAGIVILYLAVVRPLESAVEAAFAYAFAAAQLLLSVAMLGAQSYPDTTLVVGGWCLVVLGLGFFVQAVVLAVLACRGSSDSGSPPSDDEAANPLLAHVPTLQQPHHLAAAAAAKQPQSPPPNHYSSGSPSNHHSDAAADSEAPLPQTAKTKTNPLQR